MVELTLTPQRLPCTPTYVQANVREYVKWKPTLFLHYYSTSDVNVALIVSSAAPDVNGSYLCYPVILPANDEVTVGPFNCMLYAPVVSISSVCKYPADISVAALYTRWPSVAHHHQVPISVMTTTQFITVVVAGEQHITGET